MRPTITTVTSAVTTMLALSLGCVDFGFRVPPPEVEVDATPVDADGDGATACVEGPATPSADGPQIAFTTLNVDRPIVNIMVGDVVTWTNGDTMTHTVTAGVPGAPQPPPAGFDSGDIAPGGRWAYRFCTPRTAIYFCRPHANQMNGYRVIVAP